MHIIRGKVEKPKEKGEGKKLVMCGEMGMLQHETKQEGEGFDLPQSWAQLAHHSFQEKTP